MTLPDAFTETFHIADDVTDLAATRAEISARLASLSALGVKRPVTITIVHGETYRPYFPVRGARPGRPGPTCGGALMRPLIIGALLALSACPPPPKAPCATEPPPAAPWQGEGPGAFPVDPDAPGSCVKVTRCPPGGDDVCTTAWVCLDRADWGRVLRHLAAVTDWAAGAWAGCSL